MMKVIILCLGMLCCTGVALAKRELSDEEVDKDRDVRLCALTTDIEYKVMDFARKTMTHFIKKDTVCYPISVNPHENRLSMRGKNDVEYKVYFFEGEMIIEKFDLKKKKGKGGEDEVISAGKHERGEIIFKESYGNNKTNPMMFGELIFLLHNFYKLSYPMFFSYIYLENEKTMSWRTTSSLQFLSGGGYEAKFEKTDKAWVLKEYMEFDS